MIEIALEKRLDEICSLFWAKTLMLFQVLHSYQAQLASFEVSVASQCDVESSILEQLSKRIWKFGVEICEAN